MSIRVREPVDETRSAAATKDALGRVVGAIAPWLAPAIALLAIVWFGRGPARSSSAGPLAIASNADMDAGAMAAAGRVPTVAAASIALANAFDASSEDTASDVGDAAAPVPLELLADGGFVVDINVAEEQHLRRLPKIGPGRARAILELRRRLGRFRSIDELARIKGIGKSVLRTIRPHVRL